MKDVFDIGPLPVRGFDKARSIVLISILLYHLMVYYNYLTGRPSEGFEAHVGKLKNQFQNNIIIEFLKLHEMVQ